MGLKKIVAEEQALAGNCILTPTYPVIKNIEITEEQLEMLKESHFKRIELSDAILVVNVNNYIGKSTNLEIKYAKKLNKEDYGTIYFTDHELEEKETGYLVMSKIASSFTDFLNCMYLYEWEDKI